MSTNKPSIMTFENIGETGSLGNNRTSGEWEICSKKWPVVDSYGNWLISTPTERRRRTNGKFEYRVHLDRLM